MSQPPTPPPGFMQFIESADRELSQVKAELEDIAHNFERQAARELTIQAEPPTTTGGTTQPLRHEQRQPAAHQMLQKAAEQVVEETTQEMMKHAAASMRKGAAPARRIERQWFYETEHGPSEPVPEQTIIQMFESGTLPWTTLVWHRGIKDWLPAEESELINLARPATPPPLPARSRQTGAPVQPTVCSACGHPISGDDRFCSGCGQPAPNA